ncbi:MAG: hypothetical protein WCC17_08130 [Candidatus Nitrosopolaris sp.]
MIKQTGRLRGDVPRSTYIRRAVEYYLKQGKIRALWRITIYGSASGRHSVVDPMVQLQQYLH